MKWCFIFVCIYTHILKRAHRFRVSIALMFLDFSAGRCTTTGSNGPCSMPPLLQIGAVTKVGNCCSDNTQNRWWTPALKDAAMLQKESD